MIHVLLKYILFSGHVSSLILFQFCARSRLFDNCILLMCLWIFN